jgi:hypothetical protein
MSLQAHWIIRLGGWFSFVCTLFLGVIVYITTTSSTPFTTSDSVTMVTKKDGNNILVESRGFVGTDISELTIYRTLHRQYNGGQSVAVEGGVIVNQVGDYVVLRSIILPPHMTGAWCSNTVVYWRPALSLAKHSAKLPDLCFEVPEND